MRREADAALTKDRLAETVDLNQLPRHSAEYYSLELSKRYLFAKSELSAC